MNYDSSVCFSLFYKSRTYSYYYLVVDRVCCSFLVVSRRPTLKMAVRCLIYYKFFQVSSLACIFFMLVLMSYLVFACNLFESNWTPTLLHAPPLFESISSKSMKGKLNLLDWEPKTTRSSSSLKRQNKIGFETQVAWADRNNPKGLSS